MMNLKPLRWQAESVIPITFDNSLSYYEVLAKCTTYINEIIEYVQNIENELDELDVENLEEVIAEIQEIISEIPTEELSTLIADVAELKTRVNELDGTINTLQTQVNNKAPISHASANDTYGVGDGNNYGHLKLSNQIESDSSINGGTAATPKAVKSVKALVDDISNFTLSKVKKWNVKTNGKIIFVGNSYGQRGSPSYAEIVGDNFGLVEDTDFWNIAFHGASFVGSESTPTFLEKLTEWCTNNPNEKNNIGAVVVVGGVNDSRPSRCDNVGTAMEAFDAYVRSNLPNANVYIGYCAAYTYSSDSKGDRTITAMRTVMRAYMDSGRLGWQYLHGIESVLINKTLLASDEFHPSQDGIDLIGSCLTQALLSGSVNLYNRFGTTAEPALSDEQINVTLTTEIYNDVAMITLFCRSFTYTTPQEFALNGWIPLFTAKLPTLLFSTVEFGYYPLVLVGENNEVIQCIARIHYDYTQDLIRAQLRFIDNPQGATKFKAIQNVVINATKPLCFM